MKPIVGNKAIEVLEKPVFKESTLPFTSLPKESLSTVAQTDLELHLTQVRMAPIILFSSLNFFKLGVQSNSQSNSACLFNQCELFNNQHIK